MIVVTGVFLMRKWLIHRRLISRSVSLELFVVRFPPEPPGEKLLQLQQVRERIALMEQFYANLYGLRESRFASLVYGDPFFALELTIPHIGEELTFYIAVPRRLAPAVEKIIQGIFPEARVESSRDYNIFNPEGAAVGAVGMFKTNKFYPVKTYQKLEGDPLREIANVFTKLAQVGEGASFQIVARPASNVWRRKLRHHSRRLFEGKPVHTGFLQIVQTIVESLKTQTPEERERIQRGRDMKRLSPLQEEIVKALDGKAGKHLFEANIRLVASAATEARAREIVQGLSLTFEQFTDPNLNRIALSEVTGRTLKKLFFNFSFRAFDERHKMAVSTEELTSLFHFPNVPLETPKLRMAKAREAAPPAELPAEGLLLGYSMFRGEKRDVRILKEDRRRHLYAMGQTGTGKSVFMETMALQDIEEGRGVCFIDPHGDTVERLLSHVPRHRSRDVIYFNPGDVEWPLGLNMLEYDPLFPEQKTFIVNEFLGIFHKLYGAVPEAMGPMFEQYFRNATMLVMDDPSSGNTILEIGRVMAEKPFRDLKLSRAKNIVVKNFWTEVAEKAGGEAELRNMVPYITSKIDNFIANEIMRPIIAQEKSAFSFREVMDSEKILLVNLSKGRLGDLNSSFIGLIIVGKLLMAALSRVDMPEERRKDFYLFIDEFQNVTTDSIATILSEARKYRLNLTITHQFVGQLKEEIKKAVFGNVGSMAAFRIGSDDAEFIAKQFKPVFTEQDLLNLDNFNCYLKLLINGQTSRPFNIKTYPSPKGDRETAHIIKEVSRTTYGRSRDEIEREIAAKHGL